MDKTFNKLLLCIVCLVLFDCVHIDTTFKLQKDKFGVFSAIANTVSQVSQFVKTIR